MSNELVAERRAFLKKRFKSSILQLYAVFCITVYNCIAEFLFPSFVLPFSFYLPQFASNMAKTLSDNTGTSILCTLACILVLMLILACIIFAKKNYQLVNVINTVVSADIVLLIYIGLQSLVSKGFQPFFVINLLAHVWILSLSIRLRRASEGLEVLPET